MDLSIEETMIMKIFSLRKNKTHNKTKMNEFHKWNNYNKTTNNYGGLTSWIS